MVLTLGTNCSELVKTTFNLSLEQAVTNPSDHLETGIVRPPTEGGQRLPGVAIGVNFGG